LVERPGTVPGKGSVETLTARSPFRERTQLGGASSSCPMWLAVMGKTALLSGDQYLYLLWPRVGRRRVETPERSQIALGHGERLPTDPFALTPPRGAREEGLGVRCWPHSPRPPRRSFGSLRLLWPLQDDARSDVAAVSSPKGAWNLTERDSSTPPPPRRGRAKDCGRGKSPMRRDKMSTTGTPMGGQMP
jgi:hypothetical protein